ncbi:MAG: MBL fold metallo-hydrolase [Candidatus Thorarchaeota archaeon]
MNDNEFKSQWENDEVEVRIPFSAAGVGTTIHLKSKFTGKLMLLDVGDGALRDLLVAENTNFVDEIDPIAISHGHFDHVGGLHSLLGFMQMLNRTNPLNILIPNDCRQAISIIKGFRDNYKERLPFKIWYHEMSNDSGFDTDFFKIKSFEVEHYSLEGSPEEEVLEPSLGFRVQIGETMIGYSGDTRMCAGVETIVRDADLAIIEATREKTPAGPRVHLSQQEAEELGKLAKNYLLIHRVPEMSS